MPDLEPRPPQRDELTRPWHRSIALTASPDDVLEHLRQTLAAADKEGRPLLQIDGETFWWRGTIHGVLHKTDGGSRLDLHWGGVFKSSETAIMLVIVAVPLIVLVSWRIGSVFFAVLLIGLLFGCAAIGTSGQGDHIHADLVKTLGTLLTALAPLRPESGLGGYRAPHDGARLSAGTGEPGDPASA